MFNIIKTLRNYFTHELLHDNLSSYVALHFKVRHWYLVLFGGSVLPASVACGSPTSDCYNARERHTTIVRGPNINVAFPTSNFAL